MKADESKMMKWGSVDRDRKAQLKATRNRSQDIRAEIEKVYGVNTDLPDREKREKKDNRKKAGFKSDVGAYGNWSSSPRRTQG